MIYDSEGEIGTEDYKGVTWLLSKRFPPSEWNVFYITAGTNLYPLLHVHVTKNTAVLHFFPSEGSAGYISRSQDLNMPAGEMVTFRESMDGSEVQLPSQAVVSLDCAKQAVEEFMATDRLPACATWLQL